MVASKPRKSRSAARTTAAAEAQMHQEGRLTPEARAAVMRDVHGAAWSLTFTSDPRDAQYLESIRLGDVDDGDDD